MDRCDECGFDPESVDPVNGVGAVNDIGRRWQAPLTRFLPGEDGDALAAARPDERRVLPDRRSGFDRRKETSSVTSDRRSGEERRLHARRSGETSPAGLLRKTRHVPRG